MRMATHCISGKGIKILAIVCVFCLSQFFGTCVQANTPVDSKTAVLAEYRAGELLVKFNNTDEIKKITVNPKDDLETVIKRYNSSPEIEYAEPNYLYRASIIPSDTFYGNQWYLEKIKADKAWDVAREAAEVVIAVIDSGVQISHPDLKDNIWRNTGEIAGNNIDDDNNGFIDDINGWDFVNNAADPGPKFKTGFTEDGILHGTIVAGIIAASGNNAAGIAGIAWRAKIMPLKVLDDMGEGDTRNVVKAIDYAIANGADIINFSFVGFGYAQSLEDAIRRAYNQGIISVAAAGNEQSEGEGYDLDKTPMYPACHDGEQGENMVLGVAATDALDQKAAFSSHGRNCVDLSAPGVSIFSTSVYAPQHGSNGKIFNKYYDGFWSGTSMAAPMVSATAALVEAGNASLNRNEIVDLIITHTDNINRLNPMFIGGLGSGRLNVQAAVSAAKSAFDSLETKLVLAPNEQKGGQITIAALSGKTEKQFNAYESQNTGGASIAAGDIDGDGNDEIITGAGFGNGPQVHVIDSAGILKFSFFAYAENFRGGVNVAAGDIDGDGHDEIITGAGFGGGPQVRAFDSRGRVKTQFFAYNRNFRGGVKVSAANIFGGVRDHNDEIVTAPGKGGGPHVIIWNNRAQIISQFFAYNQSFTGGVNIYAADIDIDGLAEIITGAGPGGAPHVRVFNKESELLYSFYAFDVNFTGGVSAAGLILKQ